MKRGLNASLVFGIILGVLAVVFLVISIVGFVS